jgi:Transposase IS4
MVPYFGHHRCKQSIRGKLIRFGYKMWSLNSTLGYLVQFRADQGKGSVTNQELGFGGSVVVDLINSLPEGPKYKLYFASPAGSPD